MRQFRSRQFSARSFLTRQLRGPVAVVRHVHGSRQFLSRQFLARSFLTCQLRGPTSVLTVVVSSSGVDEQGLGFHRLFRVRSPVTLEDLTLEEFALLIAAGLEL